MNERPILFSTQMVQALLDGRKTMTRRIVKNPDDGVSTTMNIWSGGVELFCKGQDDLWHERVCPYGEPGNVLWVRESWTWEGNSSYNDAVPDGTFYYRADDDPFGPVKWKPSIHMPRSAARLFLRITDIRVERLKAIPDTDIKSEGVEIHIPVPGDGEPNPKLQFKRLWESINGRGSWDDNPWVWVIEFERINKH